ncbi:MAG TPA: endonuclease III [Methylocella sp.]|nr:endonuclease III [Methylocella sp.]
MPDFALGHYNAQMRKVRTAAQKTLVKSSRGGAHAQAGKAEPAPQEPRRRAGQPPSQDPARIKEIFRRFKAANPHPKGELDHVNPYTLLVAVVLSAQSTDKGVNKATKPLFLCADTPEKMLALGEEKLRDMIKTIGFFRAKAKNVIALSERLVKDFGGVVPRSREALESLPGVGRKTANVVLNIAFGEPVIAVDTHIFRVSNRIPLAIGKTPLEVERGLDALIPAAYKHDAHHWLILHGRYVCKSRKPDCGHCLISDLCQWPGKLAGKDETPVTERSSPARRPG